MSHRVYLQGKLEEVSVLMPGLRQGLRGRLTDVRRNPRHFVQLLLPVALMLAGWLSLAIGWQRTGLILMSAALLVFGGLIWIRLRRLQRSIDQGFLEAAVRADATSATIPVESPAIVGDDDGSDGASPVSLEEVHAVAALSAGVPKGLLPALEMAVLAERDNALLVVPERLLRATKNWAEATTPARWAVVDERPHDETLRSRAAGLDVVVIVDGDGEPHYEGVLDQSFFWWLPVTARLFLVSRDPASFASRLAVTHEVELAVGESAPGVVRAIVSRNKG